MEALPIENAKLLRTPVLHKSSLGSAGSINSEVTDCECLLQGPSEWPAMFHGMSSMSEKRFLAGDLYNLGVHTSGSKVLKCSTKIQ